ncbi:hypothetical protein M5689_007904 [Euphorbia peplus]|nr:hypothetical protein M5689_007904 [Euphorbia peplus]
MVSGWTVCLKGKDCSLGLFAIDENQPMDKATLTRISSHSSGHPSSLDIAGTRERLTDPLLLLCCEDSLCLYVTKHVIQGNRQSISKLKHANP